ncbi:hypothetical protein GW17_00049860 [Ensete ventricosum]|nr:hypothetical protein GW17_00049860 [Ensete ventricosum]
MQGRNFPLTNAGAEETYELHQWLSNQMVPYENGAIRRARVMYLGEYYSRVVHLGYDPFALLRERALMRSFSPTLV